MVLDGKTLQEYRVNTGVYQGSILGPKVFVLYIDNVSDNVTVSVILLSLLMVLLSIVRMIRRLICGINQSWLFNLNLTYETLDWAKK